MHMLAASCPSCRRVDVAVFVTVNVGLFLMMISSNEKVEQLSVSQP